MHKYCVERWWMNTWYVAWLVLTCCVVMDYILWLMNFDLCNYPFSSLPSEDIPFLLSPLSSLFSPLTSFLLPEVFLCWFLAFALLSLDFSRWDWRGFLSWGFMGMGWEGRGGDWGWDWCVGVYVYPSPTVSLSSVHRTPYTVHRVPWA